ncbi:MAG: hypothetical protein NTV94_16835 [Planctomycetota bacterium]|nr:hypothetical protein [Planctomycetota bacterium]
MSMHSSPASNQLPSLIDEVTAPPPAPTRKPRLALPKFTWVRRLGDKPKAWWRTRMDDPQKRPSMVRNLRIAAAVGVIGVGIGIYFAVRPTPQPDYLNGPLDDVFNYTLLTDEFNKLPVEKRLELIGQLVQRLKSMNGDDSVLMAGFAAGIAGAARKQIEENASRLAIDMWDKYAKDYTKVPESDKSEYLDQTFLNFVKMMETVGGEQRDKPDEERLAEVRRQVARDRERLKDPNRQPKGEDLGRMFRFMDQNVGGHASPEQRTRGMMMMRDMMRHFRNQDVGTGKALPPK